MIEANIWKDWIMQQVVTKFGSLKIDSGGDTVMSSDAKYYHIFILSNCHHYMLSLEHITVSAPLSILRQPNFVITCFRIQSF